LINQNNALLNRLCKAFVGSSFGHVSAADLPRHAAAASVSKPPSCGDRPDLLDAVAADTDVPVVEIDGRVAMAGDQPDLVAEPEPIGGGRNGEPSMLVGAALVGRGGLVADERWPRIEGGRLQAGIDDRTVLGRAVRHRRPHEKARLEGREGLAVAVAIAPVVRVHEDVGAALQFGIEPARRLELEAAGAGSGDRRTSDAVARQQVAGPRCLVDRLGDRLASLVPAAQVCCAEPWDACSPGKERCGSLSGLFDASGLNVRS